VNAPGATLSAKVIFTWGWETVAKLSQGAAIAGGTLQAHMATKAAKSANTVELPNLLLASMTPPPRIEDPRLGLGTNQISGRVCVHLSLIWQFRY
jgi:hypothetical protein